MQIDALAARLEAQERDLAELSQRLDARAQSRLMPRSFLLKEGDETPLAGFGLSIRLERRNPEGISGVNIFEEGGRLYPNDEAGAELRFGESFRFADSRGRRFLAVLVNAQHRFLVRDFVTLDLVPLQ